MLNQVVLVGRIVDKIKNGKDQLELILEVPRSFKNENGEYDKDSISCVLTGNIAINTSEYVKVKDLVGIKGRIESEGSILKVVAEKVTFLSSSNSSEGGE